MAARVTDLFIVGMGDSFASGEGNPDVPGALLAGPHRRLRCQREQCCAQRAIRRASATGRRSATRTFIEENARWQDQACHRSLYSHQLRAALQLAVEDPHRAVTFVGVACSGAETVFGLFLRYKGHEWVPNPPELSQISAVAEAQCARRDAPDYDLPEAYHINGRIPELKGGLVLKKCDADSARKIDLLFLSIGGNDVGFARLVANAVLSDSSMLRQLGGWFGQVHGFAEAGQQLDAAGRSPEVGQSGAAQSPARALAGIRPRDPDRLSADGAARRRQVGLPRRSGRHECAARFLSQRSQGARGQRGGRAAQRRSCRTVPSSTAGRSSRRIAPPSVAAASAPAIAMHPGPWPTRCACRARSMAPGSPTTLRMARLRARGSAGSARPTMPS